MTNEEAIDVLSDFRKFTLSILGKSIYADRCSALDMAIEALKAEPIRCGECKHQDECEEMVLFDVNDDEVIGHRLHWCSYGERREP